jgi:hypothetical protein
LIANRLTGYLDDELIAKRQLGKTDLQLPPKQGKHASNASGKHDSPGIIEYAHLRAPLPNNLKGSEIFPPSAKPQPDSYFLMVGVRCMWPICDWEMLIPVICSGEAMMVL